MMAQDMKSFLFLRFLSVFIEKNIFIEKKNPV
jgi:hypothetical protein